jgi:hypothetical protein
MECPFHVDHWRMNWKMALGWVLLVLGVGGLVSAVSHFGANSYAVGNLTGGVLILLLGIWLIRTGQPALRK